MKRVYTDCVHVPAGLVKPTDVQHGRQHVEGDEYVIIQVKATARELAVGDFVRVFRESHPVTHVFTFRENTVIRMEGGQKVVIPSDTRIVPFLGEWGLSYLIREPVSESGESSEDQRPA